MKLNKTADQLSSTLKQLLVISKDNISTETFNDVFHGICEIQRGEVSGFDIAYDAIYKATKDTAGVYLFLVQDIIKVIEDNIEH